MQEITIEQTFPCKISDVFCQISEHHRFGQIINQPITRIKVAPEGDPNGEGSIRRIGMPLGLYFEETITCYRPDTLIEYRVTKGSPVKAHCGIIRFFEDGDQSQIRYTIRFAPRWGVPGLGPLLRLLIKRPLARGLAKLAREMS